MRDRKNIDPGEYDKKIQIVEKISFEDPEGFPVEEEKLVMTTWAKVRTIRGYTILVNGDADFEKAYVNFTIRCPKTVVITRKMFVKFRDKLYRIDYPNNENFDDEELEMQCIEVSP